jgi:hypothetical protein
MHPETKIFTKEGLFKIKDLANKKDIEVLSYDEKPRSFKSEADLLVCILHSSMVLVLVIFSIVEIGILNL